MDLIDVLAVQQRFATAPTLAQLKEICLEVSNKLQFDSFVYALRTPTNFSNAQVIMLDGYPQGWVKHYFESAYYESDPVLAWCIHEIFPIRWSDLVLEPASPAAAMMLDAANYGLCDGVTMPVHTPQGELGILSFSVNAPPAQARLITEQALSIIPLLATHLHQAVRRLGYCSKEIHSNLTLRERECLTWAADGKTSNEIALLLGISENTVNFHLNNAMQKLDVVSRQHAIGKASFQRLIKPKPF
jgi:DNA-binding CsgD family transcriptional regulator